MILFATAAGRHMICSHASSHAQKGIWGDIDAAFSALNEDRRRPVNLIESLRCAPACDGAPHSSSKFYFVSASNSHLLG